MREGAETDSLTRIGVRRRMRDADEKVSGGVGGDFRIRFGGALSELLRPFVCRASATDVGRAA